jgi:uncharacterized protein YrrD
MTEQFYTLGAQVYCEDGKYGKLARLAIDPQSWQVTDLVVEEGILLKRSRVVPVSRVASAEPGVLHLAVTGDEMADFQVYGEEEYAALPDVWNPAAQPEMAVLTSELATQEANRFSPSPAAAAETRKLHRGLADHVVVVRRDTEVNGSDGNLGRLDGVMTGSAAGQVTGVMVRSGLLDVEHHLIPARLIERLGEETIQVAAGREELAASDPDPAPAGPAQTEPAQADSDQSLTTRVANALAEHPLTAATAIEVIDERGIVTLQGEVDDPETREAAAAVAESEPGVITVINSLKVNRRR